jgi:RNA polymerase sigma-70 factor (ECF subfamily)
LSSVVAEPRPADELLVVREQLALLSADDKELLMLTAWDGLSPGEAAQVLRLKPATARARLFRARRRLQARLAVAGVRPGEEDPPPYRQPNLAAHE